MYHSNKNSRNNSSPQVDEAGLKRKAIDLLARREYSFAELEKKLIPLTEDESLVYGVLQWLIDNSLQSDERFAGMYVRSKALSGYGPVRIKMELNQKGVQEHVIEQAFFDVEAELNWDESVDHLIIKKARSLNMSEPKDKNKVMGYLQRRGFNLDQIYAGLSRHETEA
ncbi:regulatory protein RecX [Bermanella sp. R86510]|uniref:regulatory protein RecX n=1 Tax=unclassified Bermanella TaxID=2627862 RepID=UPI0037C4FD98